MQILGQFLVQINNRRQRKQVEMLFAHMKRILKMDRLRLRSLSGAQDEFLLTATIVNVEEVGSGVTRPLRVTLEQDGVTRRAVFKSGDFAGAKVSA